MSEELETRLRVYYSTHAIFHECANALAAGRAREAALTAERDALRATIDAHNAKWLLRSDIGESPCIHLPDAARHDAADELTRLSQEMGLYETDGKEAP